MDIKFTRTREIIGSQVIMMSYEFEMYIKSNVEITYSYEVLTVKCLLHAPIEVNKVF